MFATGQFPIYNLLVGKALRLAFGDHIKGVVDKIDYPFVMDTHGDPPAYNDYVIKEVKDIIERGGGLN